MLMRYDMVGVPIFLCMSLLSRPDPSGSRSGRQMGLNLGHLLPQGGPLFPQRLGPPQRRLQLPQLRGLPAELLRGKPLELLEVQVPQMPVLVAMALPPAGSDLRGKKLLNWTEICKTFTENGKMFVNVFLKLILQVKF